MHPPERMWPNGANISIPTEKVDVAVFRSLGARVRPSEPVSGKWVLASSRNLRVLRSRGLVGWREGDRSHRDGQAGRADTEPSDHRGRHRWVGGFGAPRYDMRTARPSGPIRADRTAQQAAIPRPIYDAQLPRWWACWSRLTVGAWV